MEPASSPAAERARETHPGLCVIPSGVGFVAVGASTARAGARSAGPPSAIRHASARSGVMSVVGGALAPPNGPASTTGDRPSIPTGAALPYRRAAGYRTAAETPSGQDERQPARLAGRWPSRLCRGSGGPTERSCAQKSYKLTLAGHTVRLVDGWAGTRRPRSRTMLSQSHHLARTSASAAARCIARPSRGRRLVRLGVPGQPTARHQVAQKGRDPVRSGAPSTWGIQSHSAQGPTNCDRQVFPKVQPTATARKDEPSEQRDLVRPRPGGVG